MFKYFQSAILAISSLFILSTATPALSADQSLADYKYVL
ncbi:MAG: hypothetical protein H6R08_639, partial [Proteobacteria bacterium]|nr:hypothetical protein [Pseudomonadota bacterium]